MEEEAKEENNDGDGEFSIMKMMQMMTNKKSWKKKSENMMFMKLFRYKTQKEKTNGPTY